MAGVVGEVLSTTVRLLVPDADSGEVSMIVCHVADVDALDVRSNAAPGSAAPHAAGSSETKTSIDVRPSSDEAEKVKEDNATAGAAAAATPAPAVATPAPAADTAVHGSKTAESDDAGTAEGGPGARMGVGGGVLSSTLGSRSSSFGGMRQLRHQRRTLPPRSKFGRGSFTDARHRANRPAMMAITEDAGPLDVKRSIYGMRLNSKPALESSSSSSDSDDEGEAKISFAIQVANRIQYERLAQVDAKVATAMQALMIQPQVYVASAA